MTMSGEMTPCAAHAGPLNYNPVEEWFFHRIKEGRPIPIPNSGQQVCVVLNTSGRRFLKSVPAAEWCAM